MGRHKKNAGVPAGAGEINEAELIARASHVLPVNLGCAPAGAEMVYSVRPKTRKHTGPEFYLSIRPELAARLGVEEGNHLRIDVADDIGMLVRLEEACPSGASRRAQVGKSGRVMLEVAWREPLCGFFPEGKMVPLEVLKVGEEHSVVFFRLPGES